MQTGMALAREIETLNVPQGGLAFWWLGQMGYVVKVWAGGSPRILYLDPYLAPAAARQVPPLLAPEQVTHADYLLGTHDHGDHIDPTAIPGIVAASPGCRVITSRVARRHVLTLGVPPARAIGLDDGLSHEEDGLRITAVAAAHEFLDRDEALGYPYLSYVVEADGVDLFHAGDTLRYEGQLARLARWQFDVAFLPINGRDAERYARNCIGNMTYQEAVDMAGSRRPRLTVPGHYDMFANNAADPAAFAAYQEVKYPGLPYWIGEHGTAGTLAPR